METIGMIWNFMPIVSNGDGDNWHEMSNLFSAINKKKSQNVLFWKFYPEGKAVNDSCNNRQSLWTEVLCWQEMLRGCSSSLNFAYENGIGLYQKKVSSEHIRPVIYKIQIRQRGCLLYIDKYLCSI